MAPSTRRPKTLISIERFHHLVSEAIDSLPSKFRTALKNVAILVERAPTRGLLRSLGHNEDELLFGLYRGTPLTSRGSHDPILPDTITLFYEPLVEQCRSEEEVRRQVRVTVIHEIAHHFGMDDDQIARLGYG